MLRPVSSGSASRRNLLRVNRVLARFSIAPLPDSPERYSEQINLPVYVKTLLELKGEGQEAELEIVGGKFISEVASNALIVRVISNKN